MSQQAQPPPSPSSPPVGVGLGCFNFRSTRPAPFTITGQAYEDDLGQTLADIPAVDKLLLEFEEEFLKAEFHIERNTEMREEHNFFPFWQGGRIEFTIHVPERVQQDLLETGSGFIPEVLTEYFYVVTEWWFSMPVTAVIPLNATAEPDPSESVIVVRRFLEREIAKTGGNVALDNLGPSPMHADVLLYRRDNPRPHGTPPFVRRHLTRRGFMRYEFEFSTHLYGTDLQAAMEFFDAVRNELDIHYQLAQAQWAQRLRWEDINEGMDNLIAKRRRSGLRGWFENTFRTGHMLADLGIDLVEFETADLSRFQGLTNRFNSRYGTGGGYLRETVEDELSGWTSYPTQQFAALLDQFEARRITDRELIFGVGGVVLGALVGVLAA